MQFYNKQQVWTVMSLLNLYTLFYEIQKDVLKTIYRSYLFNVMKV